MVTTHHTEDTSLTDITLDAIENTSVRASRRTVTTPHYMLRRYTETKHMSPAKAIQLSKRNKLIHMYYHTGRPIFNISGDNTHYFVGTAEGVMRGYYKDCVIIPSLPDSR